MAASIRFFWKPLIIIGNSASCVTPSLPITQCDFIRLESIEVVILEEYIELTDMCLGIAKAFANDFLQCGQVRFGICCRMGSLSEGSIWWPWTRGLSRSLCRPRGRLDEDAPPPVWLRCVVNRRCEGISSLNCKTTDVASGRDPREDRLLLSLSATCFLSLWCLGLLDFTFLRSLPPLRSI